jgi:starch-binding outer membrane protein, SusD/RagB family
MKKNYIKYIICAVVLTGVVGCGKKLDQVNPNEQTANTFWTDEADAMRGINAAYGSLIVDGTYMRMTPCMLDLRGDDMRSLSPWPALFNMGRFSLGSADPAGYGWAFESYYQGVSRCNQVLENVPDIAMDENLKNRILGQAHFLRGLYFFHLVNFFGKVSLPLKSAVVTGDFYVPQATEEEGWNQVEADFAAAIPLLPNTYNGNGAVDAQVGRATKGAAMAYLGKTYLFRHKFNDAAQQFKAVIDLGIYSLVANYKDNFTETNENNSESVFEVQFSRDAGGTDLGWGGAPASTWGRTSARAITYAPRSFGWTDVQPTVGLFNEFMVEKTTTNQVDPRLNATVFYNYPGATIYGRPYQDVYGANPADLNDLFCRKYQNGDGNRADEYDWRSGINERIMRYADVLLMYAECLNEQNQTLQAYPYIQQVRSRASLPDLAVTRPGMTQAQMRDQLSHERFLEFALEGHRFDDIRRWGWLNDATKLAELKVRDPEFNTYKAGREVFPIPQSEIDNNPGYVQNTGY